LQEQLSDYYKLKDINPLDVPDVRLQLLQRTLRNSSTLASGVMSLKICSQTRDSRGTDIARTVSILPNLQYVDLPDGFFNADPLHSVLRQELRVNCPRLKYMRYEARSEHVLRNLAHSRFWSALEVLKLSHLDLDCASLLMILASLPNVRDLSLVECAKLDDSIFDLNPRLPYLAPMQILSIDGISNITTAGLVSYCARSDVNLTLTSLSIANCTGIPTHTLYNLLPLASNLKHFSVSEKVVQPFPITSTPVPPLASASLKSLYFEITCNLSTKSKHKRDPSSHYEYMADSIHANTLTGLRSLFVREIQFAGRLVIGTTSLDTCTPSQSPNAPRALQIIARAPDDLAFLLGKLANPFIQPTDPLRPPCPALTLPLELSQDFKTFAIAVKASLVPQPHSPAPWSGHAQKSILVRAEEVDSTAFLGGFLAVPLAKPVEPLIEAYTRFPPSIATTKESKGVWFKRRPKR